MLVGDEVMRPTDAQLHSLHNTAKRWVAPILSDALVNAALTKDDVTDIPGRVTKLFNMMVGYVFDIRSTHTGITRTNAMIPLFKDLKALILAVARSVAAPLERSNVGNWRRAVVAVDFVKALHCFTVGEPPDIPIDAVWRMLADANGAVTSSRETTRRLNWYSMLLRVVITFTNAGEWREAHAAMRKNPSLAKEVVDQIKKMTRWQIIAVAQLEVARWEMCMSASSRTHEDDGDGELDDTEAFNDLLNDSLAELDDVETSWLESISLDDVERMAPVGSPDTSSKRKRIPRKVPPPSPPSPPPPSSSLVMPPTMEPPLPPPMEVESDGTIKKYFKVTWNGDRTTRRIINFTLPSGVCLKRVPHDGSLLCNESIDDVNKAWY